MNSYLRELDNEVSSIQDKIRNGKIQPIILNDDFDLRALPIREKDKHIILPLANQFFKIISQSDVNERNWLNSDSEWVLLNRLITASKLLGYYEKRIKPIITIPSYIRRHNLKRFIHNKKNYL